MSIKAGLVGLPNVGKSTLFNTLTQSSVPAENYPFCTIEPHLAITEVPDERIIKLETIYQSKKIVAADVMFADIAGLVKGASQGEGLGNKFLNHIREVDLIIHVLRCFENDNIIHAHNIIDPLNDFDTIVQELMLKDLESIEKRQEKLEKLLKMNLSSVERKNYLQEQTLLHELRKAIDDLDTQKVRNLVKDAPVQTVHLLSSKNALIIANLPESDVGHEEDNKFYQALIKKFGKENVIPLCVKLEYELAQLSEEDASAMMQELGIIERGLNTVICKTYDSLGLITFFTCGPKETHAWPIKKGTNIRTASGEIHTDLERGFICAEIVNCVDVFSFGSELKAREAGKVRTEGKDYIVQDGDIVFIKFNV